MKSTSIEKYAFTKKKRKRPEDALQARVAVLLDSLGLKWFHTPNELVGGNAARGAYYKRLGLKPGVYDIIILSRVPGLPTVRGVAIELKAPGGTLSDDQKKWGENATREGWICTVRSSFDDVKEFLSTMGWQNKIK